jgi:hypothetical protein
MLLCSLFDMQLKVRHRNSRVNLRDPLTLANYQGPVSLFGTCPILLVDPLSAIDNAS